MCIIAYVPKNTEIKKETLKACFDSNRDGAGFMYQSGDEVYIQKGFMTFNKFWEAWETTPSTVDRVAHFRIATAGKISTGCCHPFPVVENYNDMQRSKCFAEIGFAHNGILSLYQPDGKMLADYSDTMMFVQMTLYPIRKHLHNIGIQNLLLETGSKFAIMTKDKVTMVGKFEQYEGSFFSNSTYKTYRYDETKWMDYYKGKYYGSESTTTTSHKSTKTHYTKMMEICEVADIMVFDGFPSKTTDINFILQIEKEYKDLQIEPAMVCKDETGTFYWCNYDGTYAPEGTIAGHSYRMIKARDLASKEVRAWIDELYYDVFGAEDDDDDAIIADYNQGYNSTYNGKY